MTQISSTSGALRRKLLPALIGATFCTTFGAGAPAQANPTLPQVAAGQAAFSQQGKVFSITNTPNTIIDWRSFSIGRDEITRFIQQGADSRVLNRITGQDPSAILGMLQSNGKVYLINPNGVLFGKDARIDVGGLVASTLNLANADFLAGKNHFAGTPAGDVANHGAITTPQGGQVYLVAPNVENTGIIRAPGGAVLLAAGHSVQLVDSANPAVHVVVSAPSDRALNLGAIVAAGGNIGIYGALLNQRGSVNADSAVAGANGRIVLKASGKALLEAGSVTSARNGAGGGGRIEVLGQQVGLTGNARVDASGASGGGTVLVGGGWHGDAAVPKAAQVFVGRDAVIAADALVQGDGGSVVAWGDDMARVQGTLSARGAGSGTGGRVETSGQRLDVAGIRVDARGPAGNGTWLLDPYDIDVTGAPAQGAALGDVADFGVGPASGVTQIATALLDGATADVVLQARHDITFSDAVAIAADGIGLSAQAGHDINVNAAITTRGGAIALTAADPAADMAFPGGTVNVGAALGSGGGNVTLGGVNLALRAPVDAGAGIARLEADGFALGAGAGVTAAEAHFGTRSETKAVTLGGTDAWLGNAALAAVNAPRIGIGTTGAAVGSVTVTGALNLTGTRAAAVGAGASGGIGMLTLRAGSIAVDNPLSAAEGLTLDALEGAVTQKAAIRAGALVATGGSVRLEHSGNRVGALAGTARSGSFSYRDANNINVAAIDGHDGISATIGAALMAPGGITQADDGHVVAPSLNLVTWGGDVYLDHDSNAIGALRAEGVGGLLLHTGGDLALESVTQAAGADGAMRIAAGGMLTARRVDAGANALLLEGSRVQVAALGSVKGGAVDLASEDGSVTAHLGSTLRGDSVRISAADVTLAGSVTASGAGGVTFRTRHGVGMTLGGLSLLPGEGMTLNNLELNLVSASTLTFDADSEGAGGSVDIGGIGAGALDRVGAVGVTAGRGVTLSRANDFGRAALRITTPQSIVNQAELKAASVALSARAIDIAGTVKADTVALQAHGGGAIDVGGTCGEGCLSITQLANVEARTVEIGTAGGTIHVSGIGASGGPDGTGGAARRNARTTRINLLAGGAVTQGDGAGIDVDTLGVEVTGGPNGGDVLLANAGNRVATVDIKAPGTVRLADAADLTGSISADALVLAVAGGIGSNTAPLQTTVTRLAAESSASHGNAAINIRNNRSGYGNALTVDLLKLAPGNGGAITLDNYGATTVAAGALVQADRGDIALTAHSPLTILGTVATGQGNIALEAGASGSTADRLLVGPQGDIRAGGQVLLAAGATVEIDPAATIGAGRGVTIRQNGNNLPPVTPPVTPPVVTPPVVDPPVVTPPVVVVPPTPPVVVPPVVTPTEPGIPVVTPPVKDPTIDPPQPPVAGIDQCRLAPTLPACAVIAPPSRDNPVKPVQLATNQVIAEINRPSRQLGGGDGPHDAGAPAPGGSAGGGGGGPTPPDDEKPKKGEGDRAAAQPGTPHDKPAIKNYCN